MARTTAKTHDGTKAPVARAALVQQYLGFVRSIAYGLCARLPQHVDPDDLISEGTIALIEAHDRFDVSRGITFQAFARHRVRGGMIDALRRSDWVPVSVRRKADLLNRVREDIRRKTGRNATREEMANKLDITPDKLDTLTTASASRALLSLDAPLSEEEGDCLVDTVKHDSPDAHEDLETRELHDRIHSALQYLTDRQRQVVSMHYFEHRSFQFIGSVLGISAPRACQIRSAALARMRWRLVPVADFSLAA